MHPMLKFDPLFAQTGLGEPDIVSNVTQLPSGVQERAAAAFGRRVDDIALKICDDVRSDALFGAADAFAWNEAIYLRKSVVDHADRRLDRLLLHETAHVLQTRNYRSGLSTSSVVVLEQEAELAAQAALDGGRFDVRGVATPLQRLNGLLGGLGIAALLIVVGAAASYYGSQQKRQSQEEEIKKWKKTLEDRKPTQREIQQIEDLRKRIQTKHTHETMWGVVPFYGSLDQILNGDNMLTKFGGVCFLVLDCTMVGGFVVRGGTKMLAQTQLKTGVRFFSGYEAQQFAKGGIIFSVNEAQAGTLRTVAQGGGTALQKEAFETVLKAMAGEGLELTTEAGVKQAIGAASKGKTIILAGTEKFANHSAVYVIRNGQVFKLHGSMLTKQIASAGSQELTEQLLRRRISQMNTMTLYNADDLIRAGLTDAHLMKIIDTWGRQGSGLALALESKLGARGCGHAQSVLLQQLGIHAEHGMARYLPILLDKSRMAGAGTHFVLNRSRQASGTLLQLGVGGAFPKGLQAFPTTLRNLEDSADDYQDMADLQLRRAVLLNDRTQPVRVHQNRQGILLERVNDINLKKPSADQKVRKIEVEMGK